MKKIVFLPYKVHLKLLYDALIRNASVRSIADNGARAYICDEHQQWSMFTPVHFFGLHLWRHRMSIQSSLPLLVKDFERTMQKTKADVLVCFDVYHWYSIQAIRYRKRHVDIKLVIYSETKRWPKSWLSRSALWFFIWYMRRNAQHIDTVLVYTQEGIGFFATHLPEFSPVLMPAPVDVEAFCVLPGKATLPRGVLRILMNARYLPYKRHEDLFQAAADLLTKGKKMQITLIGRADSGRETIEKQVEKYGLQDVVTFREPLPMNEIPGLYHVHDVLILPSYNEAIGMVVPEAMACGLPTITSDTVGANVYVKEGETGYIFPTGDVNAMVSRLLLLYDTGRLAEMGISARKQAEHFTPKIVADSLLKIVATP